MGIATAGDSRDIPHAEQIPRDVCGDASDGVVSGGVVGDFTSFVRTHAFLFRQSKHIEIKYHCIREHVDLEGEHRTAILIHVRTADQPADISTKALTGPVFKCHGKRVLGQVRKASASVTEQNRRKRPR